MMTENLDAFFTDFGVNATLGAASVRGIFDAAFLTSLGVTAGTSPVYLLAASDAASASLGDSITIGAVSYTIAGIEPDGTGMVLLRLAEA